MSTVREVEVYLPSACTYKSVWIDSSTWTTTESQTSETTSLPCSILEPGTSIRITPMARHYGGWNEAHFHPNLRLPLGCNASAGVVVLLEALASECVAVALSPDSEFVLGKSYVVHYGASGNVSTVIRRRLPSGNEAVDVQIASRVCSQDTWVPYWLCLVGGKVYVGVGPVPGERCMGVMDDSMYNQLRSPMDAVKYVGLGNSALGKHARPLKVRHVVVTTVPSTLRTTLEGLSEDFPMVNVDAETNEESKAMMEEYEKECSKAKARAKKFNIPYKEPNPQAFLNWSRARRLRANPQKGFATGMDISTPEELEKQRKRAERFGTTKAKRERVEEDGNAAGTGEGDNEENNNPIDTTPVVAIVEAWDNEELVRPHRTDPPKELWISPPDDTIEDETNNGEDNYTMAETGPAALTPERIHICSIDWSAFKQIRTDDIMAYFGSYGPSYVEWLGELSCNVHFEDKFSAARALQNLSQQLPSPVPEDVVAAKLQKQEQQQQPQDDTMGADNSMAASSSPVPDLGNMGWFVCQKPMRKVTNDRFGRRGTTARILMRIAASTDILLQKPKSTPAPPPGFTTKRVLGPGSDFDTQHRHKRRRRDYDNEERGEVNTYSDGVDHPLMSQGLRSGRDGYSMEDMEAERTQGQQGGEVAADNGDAVDTPLANGETPTS